jgi:tetratricopeptide (TPR) repeat protein
MPMRAAAPLPGPPPADQDIETLVVEAEVFARYGLTDKAIERLRALVRRRPDLVRARERMLELMAESSNPALAGEAEALAETYRSQGKTQLAGTVLERYVPGAAAGEAASGGPPAAGPEVAFEEFAVDPAVPGLEPLPVAPPAEPFEEPFDRASAGTPVAPAPIVASTPGLPAGAESEFVSYEELGSLLEDEMQKANEAPSAAAESEPPILDEQSLFADEQRFFNLAEELEKELAQESQPAEAAVVGEPERGEASLEEIFREFKKGVEQQLSAEDYETHFNIGIAYKEMGLTDEAIGEFQLASKDPARTVECCSMLGLCFLEKGMPQLAIKWYRKGLEAPDIKEVETVGLLYDLGSVYQDVGDLDLAYRTFLEVYGFNSNYRDVVHRVKDLEAVKKN